MGDENHRGLPHLPGQGGPDLGVRLRVHRGQGVVKHHHRGVLHQHPGDGHPLLLPAGEGDPPLPHHGVVPVGELGDGLIHTGHRRGVAQRRLRRVGTGGGNVLPDRSGEQEGLLEHQADLAAQGLPADVPDVHPADGDAPLPFSQVVQPVQQVDEGALSRAGPPQHREGGPLGDGEGHVLQHRLSAVAEGDVVKDDVAGQLHIPGLGPVRLLRGVEDVPHPVHGHPGLTHVAEHPAQGPHRPGQGAAVAHKGDEAPQGHAPLHRLHRAHQDHRHHLQAGEQGARRPVDGQQLAQADPELGKALVLLSEALLLEALPAKGPHHPHAGKVLLGAGGHRPLRLVGGLEPVGDLPVKNPGGQPHNGDEGQGHQGQAQVHGKHDGQVQGDEEHRAHHLYQLGAHKGADHLHVGSTSLDDIPSGMGGVPGKGQALDVSEQRIPQPFYKPF